MPIIKNFSENGKLIGERDETLNSENFQEYLSQHSQERIDGYIDATRDIIDNLSIHFSTGNPISIRTCRRIIKFYNERIMFLNDLELKTDSKVQDNSIAP